QERAQIMETQKRIEVQLLVITELASSVISRFAPSASPCQEEGLSAITLHSGTQLKGPPSKSSDFSPITLKETDTRRDVEHKEEFPTIEQEAASGTTRKALI
ncbi:hypothetical protein PIB30_104388, partial [Stylosanthes scabra]|nr:hypothetical protein [Stylosanthes scabra]